MGSILGMSSYTVILQTAALCVFFASGGFADAILFLALLCGTGLPGLNLRETSHTRKTEIFVLAAATYIAFLAFSRYARRTSRVVDLSVWDGPGRPLLFPCRTTHTRFFPKKHSFDYSYLLVGIPIGWSGTAGGMISNDQNGTGARGWYKVAAADYLERGNGHLGLRGKLDAYLKSQNVDASQYPYAYLVTAAKFLGYHFNPVSFWYLYSAEKRLAAIILEVNNTFDERRMYFLTADSTAELAEASDNGSSEGDTENRQPDDPKPIRKTWKKDFHVSPFNSRKGAYSVVAYDPLSSNMEGRGPINCTINLISSKDNAKLVARIFSDGDAIDPTEMTLFQKFKFLTSWWWVGFVTFPRIVKEAAVLFFKRGLHVWYRPEPLKSSIGRHADQTERQLEPLFRRYLKHLVEESRDPLIVKYIPSGIPDAPVETMMSNHNEENQRLAETMEFKILTPEFYSRFVHYAHDFEAVFSELNESHTIWVSEPGLLLKLFVKPLLPTPLQITSYLDYGYFTLIKKLRRRPERIERPLTSSQTSTTAPREDIRGFRLSSMDGYVLAHEDNESRKEYRSAILRLFIAERIALGNVDILRFETLTLQLLLAWACLRGS
ncbi:uncharacterized protein F4807DRAFT_185467 [Annulohypoxylon truncatum]|uniref:uncharacterized protein n=1 Tax=Annulohypoxylon truncatum TaxID=327061 RepID=UPI0020072DAF|nr:uncharacterized protein F4807DRAFT_185467 [Annulohypoxylon truncatum]KAI1207342.1 hypothetical protein F4807DRAFT_185467 [Annulohypoxylon truncatum]